MMTSGAGHSASKGDSIVQVWIDQFLCIGCGLCTVTSPATFTLRDDYLAYVKDETGVKFDPGRREGVAAVRDVDEARVTKAASECPVECIFIS
jgi:ferredoxin